MISAILAAVLAGDEAFLDLRKVDVEPHASMLLFSEDFHADPALGGGLSIHFPMPWLSRKVFGLSHDDFGLFIDGTAATMERDLIPEVEEPDGMAFFLGAGLDYALLKGETFQVAARLGVQYGNFGGISDSDDGIAALPGLSAGLRLGPSLTLSYRFEWGLADAGDGIMFHSLGFRVAF